MSKTNQKAYTGFTVTGQIDRFNFQLNRKDFSIVTKALMGTLTSGPDDGRSDIERARELGKMMWQKRLGLAMNEVAKAKAVLGSNDQD